MQWAARAETGRTSETLKGRSDEGIFLLEVISCFFGAGLILVESFTRIIGFKLKHRGSGTRTFEFQCAQVEINYCAQTVGRREESELRRQRESERKGSE